MQDAIGKYFNKKQTKPQDLTNKEHPLFIRIDTDPSTRKKVENAINAKISQEINSITIDQNYFTLVTQELERLRPLESALADSKVKVSSLEAQIEELSRKNEEQGSAFVNLERDQEYQKQLLQKQIDELLESNSDKDKELELYKQKLQEQSQRFDRINAEKDMLEGRLESKKNEVHILESKMKELYSEYKKYKKILYPNRSELEDESMGSTDISAQNQSIMDTEIKRVIDLPYMFSDTTGEKICEFLEYRDILNLRRVSKFLKLAIDNNTKYYLLVAKQIRKKWRKVQADIVRRLNFHREQAGLIPTNFIRHSFVKYIRLKETVGEYMPKVIDQSQNFIRFLDEVSEGAGPESVKFDAPDQKKGFFGSFLKTSKSNIAELPAPNTAPKQALMSQNSLPLDMNKNQGFSDILGGAESKGRIPGAENFDRPDKSPSGMDVSTRAEALLTESQKGVLSEYKNDPDIPEDLGESQEIKRLIFFKEWNNNPWCIFIPVDAISNTGKDKEQMLNKARGYVEKLLTDLDKKKNVVASSKEFLMQFMQCFVKLFIYSRVLLQESKELETLKDYVVSKYEEVKEKVVRYENFVEDHGQALDTEKQLRNFFETRAAELEAEVHKINTKILKDSEGMMILQSQVKNATQEIEYLKKEKQEGESKLKKLVKEVKNLRVKNKELEDNSGRIMNGYLDIKIAFDNLNIGL